jgi:hypothetical protein
MPNPWLNVHKSTAWAQIYGCHELFLNYNMGLHDPSMTRMLSSYPIIRAFNNNKIFSSQWLNVHKSTAAMNYFFSNMTNTVIFMTLGGLRIRHTTAVPFSPLHIWIRILVGEVIHNNYTLYYFAYMYAQICDENALIWGFPRRIGRNVDVKCWRR